MNDSLKIDDIGAFIRAALRKSGDAMTTQQEREELLRDVERIRREHSDGPEYSGLLSHAEARIRLDIQDPPYFGKSCRSPTA
jgi:hypothetical protein